MNHPIGGLTKSDGRRCKILVVDLDLLLSLLVNMQLRDRVYTVAGIPPDAKLDVALVQEDIGVNKRTAFLRVTSDAFPLVASGDRYTELCVSLTEHRLGPDIINKEAVRAILLRED